MRMITTKKVQQTADEIYVVVKSHGQNTAKTIIEQKLKQTIREERDRIIKTTRPFLTKRLPPLKHRLKMMWHLLVSPRTFLDGWTNTVLSYFVSLVREESDYGR